jgi:hypothetical protein
VDAWIADKFVVLDLTSEDDNDLEPPVPPGLGMLTAAQRALADFLRLDDELLAIAAQNSRPLEQVCDDPDALGSWVNRLPVDEKNRLLGRVVQGEAARVRIETRQLATKEDISWSRVDALIGTGKPAEYDAAVTLLTDLRALAEREGRYEKFTMHTIALRQTHARKSGLIRRLDRAGI